MQLTSCSQLIDVFYWGFSFFLFFFTDMSTCSATVWGLRVTLKKTSLNSVIEMAETAHGPALFVLGETSHRITPGCTYLQIDAQIFSMRMSWAHFCLLKNIIFIIRTRKGVFFFLKYAWHGEQRCNRIPGCVLSSTLIPFNLRFKVELCILVYFSR